VASRVPHRPDTATNVTTFLYRRPVTFAEATAAGAGALAFADPGDDVIPGSSCIPSLFMIWIRTGMYCVVFWGLVGSVSGLG